MKCLRRAGLVLFMLIAIVSAFGSSHLSTIYSSDEVIEREFAIPEHLQDGQKFTLASEELLDIGQELSLANWTRQEGGSGL